MVRLFDIAVSIFLLVTSPIFIFVVWYANVNLDGSYLAYWELMQEQGWVSTLVSSIPNPCDQTAWEYLVSFIVIQMFLMVTLPGKTYKASMTATGHVPVYTDNGFLQYMLSFLLYPALVYLDIFDPAVVYDKFGEILCASSITALSLCVLLSIKGLVALSTKDCGSSGNFITDIFWGTELYPRIFGVDVKLFTNCRFGMIYWQLGILCYAYKQYKDLGFVSTSMIVNIVLQTVYIAKFFWWERGYMSSMDIQHDRAGFYLCWGCMAFLPMIYTSHSFYLTKHPIALSLPFACFITFVGLFGIWMNYDADHQRQHFREMGGHVTIWGKPAEYIEATYKTTDGKTRQSLLLTSGWWGVARHFHYVGELTAAFSWCSPGLFNHFMPYTYFWVLFGILFHRSFRDDERCGEKYGIYWNKYKSKVPYKIIPGII
jgi:7-dehydrocholesterol reductase